MPTTNRLLQEISIDALPEEVAKGLLHLPGLVFLDSSIAEEPGSESSEKVSLIAANPTEVFEGDFFSEKDRAMLTRAWEKHRIPAEQAPDLGFPLGGLIGSIEYDGAFRFGCYPEMLIYQHQTGQWFEWGNLSRHFDCSGAAQETCPPKLRFQGATDQKEYCAGVQKARDYIAAGDIYQVNLAHRFSAKLDRPLSVRQSFQLYEQLRHASPAPHAAYLQEDERVVLSSSPELFLNISGRTIQTAPIKGTRPRFRDKEQDEKSAYDLRTSPKEISELIMITDLERNDLGQVCEFGSVQVTELLALKRYAQVFHLVSTVEGNLRPEVNPIEAVAACFPGGSITGAPKKRSREIIDEVEKSPRGLYTGTIGCFGFNDESRFNIVIRTAIVEPDEVHFHVGAGIVADSDPEMEWQETLHKAAGIFQATRQR